MMKKVIYGVFIGTALISLTGCGKKENKKEKKSFTITCNGTTTDDMGTQVSNAVYKFDKNQYITSYSIKTITTYNTEEAYKIYKESSEQTAATPENDRIKYTVSSDDASKKVTFSYEVTINEEDYEKADDKDYYKAKNVLERAESNKTKCSVSGIDKSKIK